jgi:hypothetical protein
MASFEGCLIPKKVVRSAAIPATIETVEYAARSGRLDRIPRRSMPSVLI